MFVRRDRLPGWISRSSTRAILAVNSTPAFANLSEVRADVLMVNAEQTFSNRRIQFAVLAARHALPGGIHHKTFANSPKSEVDEGDRLSDIERNRLVGVDARRRIS